MSQPTPPSTTLASPDDVEHAFYDALDSGDADLLMHCWSEEDESVCVHPTGARLTGVPLIRESWRAIFASTRLRIHSETVARWQGSVMAVHHLSETLFVGDDPAPHGPLHVTHVYVRGAHGWRLACRHASAADDGHQAMADAIPHTLH